MSKSGKLLGALLHAFDLSFRELNEKKRLISSIRVEGTTFASNDGDHNGRSGCIRTRSSSGGCGNHGRTDRESKKKKEDRHFHLKTNWYRRSQAVRAILQSPG